MPGTPDSPPPTVQCDTTLADTTRDIGQQIAPLVRDNYAICLAPGDYFLTSREWGIEISNVEDFRIIGSGYATNISLPTELIAGIVIRDTVRNLELRDFRLTGPGVVNPTRQIIGIHMWVTPSFNVDGITISGLHVTGVNIGVVATGRERGFVTRPARNVLIAQSSLYDIAGSLSGYGYCITLDAVTNVRVLNNFFRNCHRHSVYVSGGAGPVIVGGNFVLDHAQTAEHHNVHWGAIVVARSSNVTVAHNRLVNSRSIGITAEYDERDRQPSRGLLILGNVSVRPNTAQDIYVNADSTTRVTLWGNTPGRLVCRVLSLPDDCTSDTSYLEREPDRWQGTQAMVPANRSQEDQRLYVMRRDTLFAVDPDYGEDPSGWRHSASPTNWSGFQAMAGAMKDRLYLVQGDLLHEVNPVEWSYRYSPSKWTPLRAATVSTARNLVVLFVGKQIYWVNPTDWSFTADSSSTNWSDTRTLVLGSLVDGSSAAMLFVEKGRASTPPHRRDLAQVPFR